MKKLKVLLKRAGVILKVLFKRACVILFLLVAWWQLSKNMNPLFVPSPKSVYEGILALIENKQLIMGTYYSFYRVAIASILSGIVSVILGLLIYSFKFVRTTMYPIINSMRYIPVTAFYPLLIMWCGIGEQMKIIFLFIVIFVYMMPSMYNIFSEISEDLIDTGYTIGMNKSQVIYMVLLPSSLPAIVQTFIMLFAVGFTYIPFVESINAKYGLGYVIQQSSSRGRTDLVFVGIVAIMFISFLFDNGARYLAGKIFPWRTNNDQSKWS